MRSAYHADSALAAEAALTALAAELDKTHPSAAASVREGMADTLTVLRLGVLLRSVSLGARQVAQALKWLLSSAAPESSCRGGGRWSGG